MHRPFSRAALLVALLAPLPLIAQITDQDVVDALPTLSNGTFIIGDNSAFDVTVDASTEILATSTDATLTIRNGSDYTASDDDLIVTSADGHVASLVIDGANVDLGRSNGEITGKAGFADFTDDVANITISGGSTVDIRRFKGQGDNTSDNIVMNVTITGTGTSVRTDTSDALVLSGDTLNITVSNGATYSLGGTGSSFGIKNYTIADGGTLESRSTWAIANLDSFNFESGGTFVAHGSVSGLGSIDSGRTVDLSGGGTFSDAVTMNGGTLITADYDFSTLVFSSGTLNISGAASNLPDITSGITLNLTGGGSLSTATTLNGGTLNGGNFDLNGNLTFTSGTLNVSGTLQNLTHLPTGSTVNMSGASADLILSQELSITGGTLNIDNGASVTVLDDVTLGAGSLGFASSGGNLDLDGGTLNVASMDTALTLNANASITGNGSIFGDISLGSGGTVDGDETGFNIYGDVSGSGTLADATVFGNLNIGSSPGEMTLQGVTLSATTTVTMEIMGTGSGEFDTLIADAFTDVSAASLSIGFSFVPSTESSWQLISGGVAPLSFANISVPEGWTLNSVGVLSAVPEPSTYALLLGAGSLVFAAQRRRRA
jgi:hypothetical protein